MNSYTKYWKGYADFKGRSSQQDFWVPILINLAISVGLLVAVICSTTTVVSASLLSSAVFCLFVGLLVGWKLARLVPDAAVIVRRTHDVGLTGWIGVVIYIGSFIPYIDLAAGVLLVIIGCLATDSAKLSAFTWQPDSQKPASTETASSSSDAQSSATSAANTVNNSDAKHYEQLSLDLDFDDSNQKSEDHDKSAK